MSNVTINSFVPPLETRTQCKYFFPLSFQSFIQEIINNQWTVISFDIRYYFFIIVLFFSFNVCLTNSKTSWNGGTSRFVIRSPISTNIPMFTSGRFTYGRLSSQSPRLEKALAFFYFIFSINYYSFPYQSNRNHEIWTTVEKTCLFAQKHFLFYKIAHSSSILLFLLLFSNYVMRFKTRLWIFIHPILFLP